MVCVVAKRHVGLLNPVWNTWVTLFLNMEFLKVPKVDPVLNMQIPNHVSTLRSFLESVQLYAKFLLSCFSTDAAPLYKFLRNDVSWKWVSVDAKTFDKLKERLSSNSLLVYFDPTFTLGIACNASSVGISATLFHSYSNRDEKPIANVSKYCLHLTTSTVRYRRNSSPSFLQ